VTLHEEPPVVDLDVILRDQQDEHSRVTPVQLLLVILGGLVGVAGMLITLVIVAPPILDLVSWIHTLQEAVNR